MQKCSIINVSLGSKYASVSSSDHAQHDWYITVKKKPGNKSINPLSANPAKWSNNLKQFVSKLPKNYLSMFDHFMGLALEGLIKYIPSTIARISIWSPISTG